MVQRIVLILLSVGMIGLITYFGGQVKMLPPIENTPTLGPDAPPRDKQLPELPPMPLPLEAPMELMA